MKRLIYTLVFGLSAISTLSGASPGKTSLNITNASITRDDDKLAVTFEIADYRIPSAYKVTLTPIIEQGGHRVELPSTTLTGRKMDMLDRRSGDTSGQKIRITRKSPEVIQYAISVEYEDWMSEVSLSVNETWQNCCNEKERTPRNLLSNISLSPTWVPYYNHTPLPYELSELEKYDLDNPFLHPMEDYAKRYDILRSDRKKGAAVVYFKAGSAEIDPWFKGNREALDAIARAFELIELDPRATLRSIMVAGYASPEGSLTLNTTLAQQRAEAVRHFVLTRMGTPSYNLFELHNGREDWEGLRNLVEQSRMRDRQMVLDVIDSYTMEQEQRKYRLSIMSAGEPYEYMLSNFYPSLRNAGYVQVYYGIDRHAGPAQPYTDGNGRNTWIDSESPENRTVQTINSAVVLMNAERFAEALETLQSVRGERRAHNYLGVCYMMTGDKANAEHFLQLAAQEGDPDAVSNLKQFRR